MRILRRFRIWRRKRALLRLIDEHGARDVLALRGFSFLRMLERNVYGNLIAYPEDNA